MLVPFKLLLREIADRSLRDAEFPRDLRLGQPVVKQAQKLLPPFDHRPFPLPLLHRCHVRALELLHAIADRALRDVELPRYLRLRQPVVKQALNLLPPFDLPLPRPLPRPLSLPPRPHAHVLARPREGAFLDYALVLNVCDGVAMLLDGHQARHRHPKDSRLFREGDGEVHADAQRRAPGQDPMERGELLAEDAAARSAHDVDAGGPHPECLALSLHDRVHVAFGRMDV